MVKLYLTQKAAIAAAAAAAVPFHPQHTVTPGAACNPSFASSNSAVPPSDPR